MRTLSRRRLLIWTAIPLLVAQIGCAARGVHLPPAESSAPVSERECEEYSKQQKTKSVAGLRVLGVVLIPVGLGIAVLAIAAGSPTGAMAFGLPWDAFQAANRNAKENRATREVALKSCLEGVALQQTVGPEHPDVARSLHALANWYVSVAAFERAEALYRRALAIREKALGPEHADVAITLEGYAALLRKTNREAEATEMEARAKAIRAKAEQQAQPQDVESGDKRELQPTE